MRLNITDQVLKIGHPNGLKKNYTETIVLISLSSFEVQMEVWDLRPQITKTAELCQFSAYFAKIRIVLPKYKSDLYIPKYF